MQNKKPFHSYSITSLVFALLFWIPLLNLFAAVLAIIFGIIALKEIKKDNKTRGKGFAIIGIVLGIMTLILSILGFILYPEAYLGTNSTLI